MRIGLTRLPEAAMACAALLLVSGCEVIGGGTEADGLTYAYAFPTCGPTDGPALEILLVGEERWASCETMARLAYGPGSSRPFVSVVLPGFWEPDVPSVHVLEEEPGVGYRQGGWGQRCTAPDACVRAARGTIAFEGTRAQPVVSFDLVFEDGTSARGRLPLRRCERRFLCG